MKLNIKFKVIIGIIIGLLLSPILYQMVCWEIYKLNPNIVANKNEYYRTLSNEQLIHKLGIWNIGWFDIALNVLAERKATEAVPVIIKMLKSPFKYHRESAMRALAEIGDERAIEPLMEIVNKSDSFIDYHEALSALVEMRYEGIFPYVTKWAEREDGYRNGSIWMLKKLAKLEGILILKEIESKLEKIKGDDWNVDFVKKEIPEAIAHIKKVNN